MTRAAGRPAGRSRYVAVAVAVAGVAALVGIASLSVDRLRGGDDRRRAEAMTLEADARGVAAAQQFLDRYVDAEGRVVRPEDGNDTVSEGQAYGMLLSAAVGDRERFDLLWTWTRDHLLQPNGLLAWRWAGGAVVDPSPAADADLDAAYALLLAAERFDQPQLQQDGVALGQAILTHETVAGPDGRPVLVAGPWARQEEPILNPSYTFLVAYERLGQASGDPRWEQMAQLAVEQLTQLTQGGTTLPPDWARLRADGTVVPAPAPGQAEVRYGYEAFRVLPRTAAACSPAARDLAAALWTPVSKTVEERAETHHLDGRPERPGSNPNLLVAGAAAAHAAGHTERRDALLAEAGEAQSAHPSYYLGAWTALGHLLLDGVSLARCPDQTTSTTTAADVSTTTTTAAPDPSTTSTTAAPGLSTTSTAVADQTTSTTAATDQTTSTTAAADVSTTAPAPPPLLGQQG